MISPPTYPLRPQNGGPLPTAAPKLGQWCYEPKYNGWRALAHAPTGAMFNRYGQWLSIAHEFLPALDSLKDCPFEWLDCEALERRHGLGRGSLFVFDALIPGTYQARKKALEAWMLGSRVKPGERAREVLPIWLPPDPDRIYYVPSCTGDMRGFYTNLQGANARVGCAFYEGVVAKRADSTYPLQLDDPNREFSGWIKHRFV